jgi:murein DD-endopeptidase MepM/ murein hydrolase activator NlpD
MPLWPLAGLILSLALHLSVGAQTSATGYPTSAAMFVADGFDFPVGKPDGEGFYKARGYSPNGHLGEDWNGRGGGDTDLGLPVFAIGHGMVMFAQDYGLGWGNVVILRHAYDEGTTRKFIDSLYGHLDRVDVRPGQHVRRGQQVGTIGNNRGMYDAHLHLEVRRDLRVGMMRHLFPRDERVYFSPTDFIAARRSLPARTTTGIVPINTFVAGTPPEYRQQTGPQPSRSSAHSPGLRVPSLSEQMRAGGREWDMDGFEALRKR